MEPVDPPVWGVMYTGLQSNRTRCQRNKKKQEEKKKRKHRRRGQCDQAGAAVVSASAESAVVEVGESLEGRILLFWLIALRRESI